MYSTRLKDERFVVDSIALLEKARVIQFVVDTGAKYTCCNYASFDENLCESSMKGKEIKFLGGFVKGKPVKFYKCALEQFTIGNIDMNAQDIWVTFDQRVTDTVLGVDILKQIIMITNPYNQQVYFLSEWLKPPPLGGTF